MSPTAHRRVEVGDLQTLLDDACRRHRVPGAVLGVRQHGDSTVVAHGVANVSTGEPMTPQTVSQVASVSKLFTASAVHRLLGEHGIGLDTPIGALVPEVATLDDGVSVRRLLDHTSGVEGDLWDDFGANGDAVSRFTAAVAGVGSIAPPGALMSYCNAGYVVLGRLVELLGGATFDRVIDRLVVQSAGLRRTTLRLTDAVQHRIALGHDLTPAGTLVTRPFISMRCLSPTGGVMSTVDDLLDLVTSLPDAMRLRSSTNPDPWTAGPGWCLGMTDCTGPDGEPVFGHDGLWIGSGAYVRHVPGLHLTIAMVGAAGHARTVWQQVYAELLQRAGLRGIETPRPSAGLEVAPERYTGSYRRLSQEVEVREEHGRLLMTSTPTGAIAALSAPTTVELQPCAPDVFLARASTGVDLPVVFIGDDDRAEYLHTGMRAARRAR